ncbi:type I-C CRISPR-associated endonuclease Cas1c [Methylotuvimicrobium alcaliphilum]|uniref:CRISPR-associated endonuclease Cas1 n=1 Tax=Methylotuvimicrobium alcaliphilum (strain DSM 19304 / NCIMB 14124 / VKM B-2133 / 20Z) TaxID=1091494 RepID=G4SWY5_META2|nr:type I-C CRISPR-associated endonuclease Cas1c [Methylotuvimicrobium alcaliphilum]CCE23040.1 CRISPR-associated protein Cas1 [Methylotuvimicrobium alcaliphilum 20Z]
MKQALNTLYVTTPEAYLRLEGETVCVMIEKQKKMQVPLHHLGAFVLFDNVMLSPALLGRCAEDGLSVVWLNRSGRFRARLEGPVNGNVLLRQAQYRAADDRDKSIKLAKRFIAGKIRNSRQILMRGARENKSEAEKSNLVHASRLLAGNLKKLPTVQTHDELRGVEGDSARIYFDALPKIIKPSARETFNFTTRNRRPPRDPFNALASFLYALVLSDCRSALETVGLDPQLGFLHAVRPGRQSLALDMLEEFRAPLCDRLALTLINREQLNAKDFDKREGGSVLLNDKGRKTVIGAFQTRKQEELNHPVLDQSLPIGLLAQIQARLLARFLREDSEDYIPYLQR